MSLTLKKIFCRFYILQISRIELHVADFLELDLLDLVAVLLVLVPACLHWFVGADQSFLLLAHRLDGLLFALVTYLPGLLLAVLGVAVLLGLLWAGLHFKLADFLWLKVAVLFLDREGEDVGEFLAVPVNIRLANLDLNLTGDVVTALCWLPCTYNTFRSVTIILSTLIPLTVELNGICTGHVVDDLFFHVTVRGLNIRALVVILRGHVDLVGGVAHSVLSREAPLDLVSLLQCLVVDGLDQITDELIHIKTDTFDLCFDDSSTVVEQSGNARLLILGVASPLCVWLALVLEHHLLDHVAVGVLVDTVAPHVGLSNIRIVTLRGCRCWILWRRWESKNHRQAGKVDQIVH